MERHIFTASEVFKAIKERASGREIHDICSELQIEEQVFYDWQTKYGSSITENIELLEWMEKDNNQLKNMFADLVIKNRNLMNMYSEKGWALLQRGC